VIEILSIADAKKVSKRILREVTLLSRIESLLEDMNIDEVTIKEAIDLSTMNRRTGVFHASTIGSQSGTSLDGKYPMGCGREMYYGITNADKEGNWEPRMRRILDTGSAIHAQLQGYLNAVAARTEGESFIPEADIDPDKNKIANLLDISGHTDGIYEILAKAFRIRIGVEIKSINDAGYKKTSGPHPEHLMQGTVYQKCLDLPVMVFIYYNKNDSSILEFPHVYDPRRWNAIEKKLNHIRDLAMKGELPERETGFQCGRCGYKAVCKPPRRIRGAALNRAFNR
jgi:CRISPR/Cas system-associated exonuclease Cas4 (RecB family)